MKILKVESLKKSFGGLKAVDNFSFSINQGDIHGLIGPNGSGKTTLVNMISGLYSIDSGKVIFEEIEITGYPLHRLPSLGIFRTFQNLEICRNMNVMDNILLGFSCFLDRSFWKSAFKLKKIIQQEKIYSEKAYQLIKEFGLEKYCDYPAGKMSYGNQKKMEIARSIAGQPKLLMLDEPVAGVGPKEREELIEIIKKLNQGKNGSPVTILLIEHNMKMVMDLSDKITVINFGVKLIEDIPKKIRNNPQVIEAYLGKAVKV